MSFCARPIVAAKSAVKHSDDRHDEHRVGGEAEEDVAAGHHVDAGRDHRRGVDQGRDRRRARHRVRQPDVERKLRGLAARPDEEAEADERQVRRDARRIGRGGGEDLAEVERAEEREDAEDPEDEAEVADPVDDEGLLAGVGRGFLVVVVPDQEVRAEPDALPTRRRAAGSCRRARARASRT